MCLVPQLGLRSAESAQSLDLGPFFSSDGTLLSSRAADEGARRDAPTEVLWCWGVDDPRCSPADSPQDHAPRAIQSPHCVAVLEHPLRWPVIDAGSPFSYSDARDGGRPGVRDRLERPPRA